MSTTTVKLYRKDEDSAFFEYSAMNNNVAITIKEAVNRGVKLDYLTLDDTDLSNLTLLAAGGSFRGARFSKVNLNHADFTRSSFIGAEFIDCKMNGAWFNHANLSRVTMSKVEAEEASFWEANLMDSTIVNSQLGRSRFSWGRLDGARLLGCDLSHTQFIGATLVGCDLYESCIYGVRLRQALLTGARYGKAKMENGVLTLGDLGFMVHIFDRHIRVGCKLFSTREWENFTDDELSVMWPSALSFATKYKDYILRVAKAHQGPVGC